VNYLGYPGTMGTPLIDYIIADPVVLPFTDQAHFDEKIVHLPDCYQVNDSTVDVDPTADTRAQHGLPAEAFVFCSLNGSQKITQVIFSVWMRVLTAVPHSVLWLFHDNDTAVRNLQNAARQRGVDPSRLVFAPKMAHSKHLARYRHADLFLDTAPYNAHTTASDALRAHVPLLTVRGSTFASRVSSSLLHAVGVPELIADDVQAYEKAACQLANDPASLSKLRERIAEGVRTGPLFDTARFAQGIETAFLHMHAAAGQPRRAFAVCADGTINEQ
jgi:predicted O-linked N-acetylglucosamine transferase (SPINDLY family)